MAATTAALRAAAPHLLGMVAQEFHFDRFVLRPRSRELLDDGAPVRIGDRAFDLLAALVEARGDTVSRDALFARAWPGRVVIDDNLKVQVMALRKLLGADAVATVPRRGYRFGMALRDGNERCVEVPAPVGLIGREQELAQLRRTLVSSRLVSLVGPGGVGKTRLAAATAESLAARFADGVHVVELVSLADARRVPEAVARTLRLPALSGRVEDGARARGVDERALARSIDERALARACTPLAVLIVLDNCEHVLGAVRSLVECLLEAAPRVVVLATSQEPLGLRDEQVLRLQGLRCGDAVAGAQPAPAVQLFATRAGAVDASFRLDEGNAGAVAEICRRLEGLPLALELAAARVPLLGAAGVLQRLDQQLKLLTRGSADAPERHQTLRAAMQWSHGLLDATQKTVFRRLAVFADSFTLPGAQAVAGDGEIDEWMVLDALDALVAKSLVQVVQTGTPKRARLLATARAFALERLEESGEYGATQRRHAGWVHRVFEQAAPVVQDEPLRRWLDALWPEVHDLRAALRWAADHDEELLLALVGLAGSFWAPAPLDREAAQWLAAARASVHENTPPLLAARYWQAVALRSVNPVVPIAESLEAAQRALQLFDQLSDDIGRYRMLGLLVQHGRRVSPPLPVHDLLERMRALERPDWPPLRRMLRMRAEGIVMARAGDWHAYRERFRQEAEMLREAGDEMRLWGALHHVALAEIALGQPRAAIGVMAPVVQRLREVGLLREQWTRPVVLLLARIECGEGMAAAALVCEVITLLRVAGAPTWIADHLSLWALDVGDAELAARLSGWADAAIARGTEPRNWHARAVHERVNARLGVQLDAAAQARLHAEGGALSDDAALRAVLARAGASNGMAQR
jgi:predicted ATPase/DNA-binding winged helix-turn-helix (wHTH) protein